MRLASSELAKTLLKVSLRHAGRNVAATRLRPSGCDSPLHLNEEVSYDPAMCET